jgi:hypothetical protein
MTSCEALLPASLEYLRKFGLTCTEGGNTSVLLSQKDQPRTIHLEECPAIEVLFIRTSLSRGGRVSHFTLPEDRALMTFDDQRNPPKRWSFRTYRYHGGAHAICTKIKHDDHPNQNLAEWPLSASSIEKIISRFVINARPV